MTTLLMQEHVDREIYPLHLPLLVNRVLVKRIEIHIMQPIQPYKGQHIDCRSSTEKYVFIFKLKLSKTKNVTCHSVPKN